MDIQANKPVSSVPASPAAREQVAETANVAPQRAPAPVEEPKPVQLPARDLQHTLKVVAEQLREYMKSNDRDLEFSVDDSAGSTVITVRDASSGDVIRQIPNEEALRIMRRLNADSGTLVDLTA